MMDLDTFQHLRIGNKLNVSDTTKLIAYGGNELHTYNLVFYVIKSTKQPLLGLPDF